MNAISERIEAVIQSQNLSAASFADQIGVQRSSVSHVLSGRNKPSMTFIQKILSNFPKVDANWLITGNAKAVQSSNEQPVINTESNTETKSKSNAKAVEKIIIFYTDQTFETYHQA